MSRFLQLARLTPKSLIAAKIMATSCSDFERQVGLGPLGKDKAFIKLRNNVDRVRYILSLKSVRDATVSENRSLKNDQMAAMSLKEAEAQWKSGQVIQAHQFYNEAVLFSIPSSTVYHRALLGRSKCLSSEGRLMEALRDIDISLDQSYRNEVLDDTLTRREDLVQAIHASKGGLKPDPMILRSPPTSLSSWGDDRTKIPVEIPPLDGPPNPNIPVAIDAISLVESKDKGRGLVAVKDIPAGSNIMVEKPFLYAPEPSVRNLCCAHCTVLVDNPIPCSECTEIVFCSLYCRGKHSSFHSMECGRLHLLDESCHRAVRLALKNGVSALVKPYETIKFGDFSDSMNPRHIDHLTGNSEKRQPSQIMSQALEAAFCLRWLEASQFLPVKMPSEDKVMACATLMDYLQKCSVNVFMLPDHMRGGETVDLGSVMYAAISFINHSCYANCDWYYCGDIEVIKALRRIRAGEPLSINYQSWCGLYSETNLEQRRKHHQRDYFFNCDCVACAGMWGEPAGKKASSCPNAAPWVLEVSNHIKRVIDKERAFDPKMMTSLVEIVEGYDKILTDSHGPNSRPFLEMEEVTKILMKGLRILPRFQYRQQP